MIERGNGKENRKRGEEWNGRERGIKGKREKESGRGGMSFIGMISNI